MRALYALCRTTDDLVDARGDGDEMERGAALADWRRRVAQLQPNGEDLVLLAWSDTRARFRIPLAYAEQLVDGVSRDLRQKRYASFDELAAYAYGVASTVGLMSMHIIGFGSQNGERAIPYAIRLGVALQLTNILRDVGEDWQTGRLYLPQDELERFGVSEAAIAEKRVDARWRALMRFQIDRARRIYAQARPGIRLLHRDGRLAVVAAAGLYAAILDDIERRDFDVFGRRAHVGRWGKLRCMPSILWLSR
jgi:phytoene synthase